MSISQSTAIYLLLYYSLQRFCYTPSSLSQIKETYAFLYIEQIP